MSIKRSPWISFFNTGGCNGCTLECTACITPRYDIERFGCLIKESAKHCDILMVTGPVTRRCQRRLLKIYEQMNEPKKVVAVGNCTISGELFRNGYEFDKPLDEVIPVDVYVQGCPPRPEAIVKGLLEVLGRG
jgi:membrane-bound hydrogenase subunit mbhJ